MILLNISIRFVRDRESKFGVVILPDGEDSRKLFSPCDRRGGAHIQATLRKNTRKVKHALAPAPREQPQSAIHEQFRHSCFVVEKSNWTATLRKNTRKVKHALAPAPGEQPQSAIHEQFRHPCFVVEKSNWTDGCGQG
eukprot:CAMPEP_0184690254 /NCGR_PEP_ID=MMETSP0312-20130426/31117_1 /TAXON_ID=31354 /ORGANISM="Compsopogon coeruleus, Strain SAG 36.94" /LENGTH=137 /DNA_ID=CAMNT_0027147715 /DNA_START=976 /DNA_END=1389 /DNA_ORIENTATION=-